MAVFETETFSKHRTKLELQNFKLTENPPFYIHAVSGWAFTKLKKMIIEATFTGKNSLGYETGKQYKLKVADFGGMTIRRIDDTRKCPYQSISAFLRNWSNIKIVP